MLSRSRSAAGPAPGGGGPESLTAGQPRVSELAAQGRTNREIADELIVTVSTVEFNLSQAFRKLGGGGARAELSDALAVAGTRGRPTLMPQLG